MTRYHRRVIRIRAEDSPNVRIALLQHKMGWPITGETVVPGVLSWDEYVRRRSTWDKIRQTVGLDAEFYEGAEVLLYPPDWLNRAEAAADSLGDRFRPGKAIGVDPAEGGDSTCWAVVDRQGLIHLESLKTADTAVIPNHTLALMTRYGVKAADVVFDRGGGGKQHADLLRARGHPVRTVAFGESLSLEPRRAMVPIGEKKDVREERYEYKNRRAQMYGELRELLDPSNPFGPFALPARYDELRRQLAVIPLWFDEEGKLILPPKNRRPDAAEHSTKVTLVDLIGHSPDEADALVLAVHGLLHRHRTGAVAGAVGR